MNCFDLWCSFLWTKLVLNSCIFLLWLMPTHVLYQWVWLPVWPPYAKRSHSITQGIAWVKKKQAFQSNWHVQTKNKSTMSYLFPDNNANVTSQQFPLEINWLKIYKMLKDVNCVHTMHSGLNVLTMSWKFRNVIGIYKSFI